jgi:formate/nitrite transporter
MKLDPHVSETFRRARPVAGSAYDAALPQEAALRCEAAGVTKASRDATALLALAVLAGAFIAFGAIFMVVAVSGAQGLPFGLVRVVGGLAFSLGLILVIVGGAELFTGDALMVMAWAGGRIRGRALARAWSIILVGNLVGALGTAALVFLAGHHHFGGAAIGRTVLAIAAQKLSLPLHEVFVLGILCNVLVCLAVWMTFGARSVADKVAVIVLPIAAFVAAGFEHSIANMYLHGYALALKFGAEPAFWAAVGATQADFAGITVSAAAANVGAALLGNIVGGGVLVGVIYWFIYLRRRPKPER